MSTLVSVYLGIGSNIEPEKNIQKALELLKEQFGQLRQSKRYQTKAVGFKGRNFINMVVAFDAQDNLSECLKQLLGIEQACGRDRTQEQGKGNRALDLDLLLFGELEGKFEGCVLPRPEIFERQFVWQPLLELLPGSEHSELCIAVKNQILQLSGKVPALEAEL